MSFVKSSLNGIFELLLQANTHAENGSNSLAIPLLVQATRELESLNGRMRAEQYNIIAENIESLKVAYSRNHVPEQQEFFAQQTVTGVKGRPSLNIPLGQIQMLANEGYSAQRMANIFKCSSSLIYQKCYRAGIKLKDKYSTINDSDLKEIIKGLHERYPNAGYVMMGGYLRAQDLFIQRNRIRKLLKEVDPQITARKSQILKRRVYKVSTPNALWHCDAHLKLVRWGFVTHGCIDGYSRLIIHLQCQTSITAEPVVKLFIQSVRKHGLPSRVRTDHGYENLFVAYVMNILRGLNRRSHIAGKSVHNIRIERLWRDVYQQVVSTFYLQFYEMEDERILNVDNHIDLFALQQVYTSVINEHLSTFSSAWNQHRLRTTNRTPRQLWIEGMLSNLYSGHTTTNELFISRSVSLQERFYNAMEEFGMDTRIISLREATPSALTVSLDIDYDTDRVFAIVNGLQKPKEKYVLLRQYLNSLN